MSPAARRGVELGATLAIAVCLLSGCGSSSLSARQLKVRAGRICATAQRRTAGIAAPTDPDQASRFLLRGVDALAPQLTALHELRPSADLRAGYAHALTAADRELALLRSAQTGLSHGGDPVLAIRSLQRELTSAERRAADAWRTVDVPACSALLG